MRTVDQVRNSRNDRFLAFSMEIAPLIHSQKHSVLAMILGMVALDRCRMRPFWYKKGLKINTADYVNVLKDMVKSWQDEYYPNGNYVFQQDSAPSHKSKKTQD